MADKAYYQQRAIVERALAEAATDVTATRAHSIMAERYEDLAAGKAAARQVIKRPKPEQAPTGPEQSIE